MEPVNRHRRRRKASPEALRCRAPQAAHGVPPARFPAGFSAGFPIPEPGAAPRTAAPRSYTATRWRRGGGGGGLMLLINPSAHFLITLIPNYAYFGRHKPLLFAQVPQILPKALGAPGHLRGTPGRRGQEASVFTRWSQSAHSHPRIRLSLRDTEAFLLL